MKDFSLNRNYNRAEVSGYVFSHNLAERVSGPNAKKPGTKFISGNVEIAVDEAATETISVNFGYVVETYNSGKPNDSYALLKNIIETNKTVQAVGIENAMKVRVQGDIEVNDFVGRDGEMVTTQRIRGSFIHNDTTFNGKSSFQADVLLSKYREVEVDEGENYGEVSGYAFNYRNEFLPVKFRVMPESGGMNYFDNCDITSKNPLLTHVWGSITVNTVVREIEGETAFGAPAVSSTTSQFRTWDIAGAAGEPYEFGDDEVMTLDDVKSCLAIREQHLAEVRQRYEERQQADNSFAAPASNVSVDDDDDDFDF